MSIKTDAVVIRDETTTGANTAVRVGTNLVAIADDLVAKQAAIDLNTAKTGITTQQASDITTNNAKVGVTAQLVSDVDTNTLKVGITTQQAADIVTNNAKVGVTTEEANPDVVSQVEAEAGVATTERIWTAERVKQAIVALGGSGSVDDTAYGISWDGVTGVAPSKNTIYDKIETVIAGVGTGATPETFTAVGGETEWVLTNPITSSHKFFVNGVKLVEGTDYTQTASTITFTGYTSVAGHEWEYYPDIAVPTTYNASETSIADAGGLITATDVEGALQENRTAINLNTAKVGVTTELKATDIDTLAELNAIVTDATLIDTADARLSDARTPTAHTHDLTTDVGATILPVANGGTNLTSLSTLLNSNVTSTTLGLGNVDNTSDVNKPVSTAQQTALDLKANLGVPQNSQSAAYTLVLSDANKHILHPSADTTARTFTIPANASVAFPIGTTVSFVNQNAGGVITIAITTDTMRLAGAGTTGSRTLAANGIATAIKVTSTEWLINGTNLT